MVKAAGAFRMKVTSYPACQFTALCGRVYGLLRAFLVKGGGTLGNDDKRLQKGAEREPLPREVKVLDNSRRKGYS